MVWRVSPCHNEIARVVRGQDDESTPDSQCPTRVNQDLPISSTHHQLLLDKDVSVDSMSYKTEIQGIISARPQTPSALTLEARG